MLTALMMFVVGLAPFAALLLCLNWRDRRRSRVLLVSAMINAALERHPVDDALVEAFRSIPEDYELVLQAAPDPAGREGRLHARRVYLPT
jgi:hypothetical protein